MFSQKLLPSLDPKTFWNYQIRPKKNKPLNFYPIACHIVTKGSLSSPNRIFLRSGAESRAFLMTDEQVCLNFHNNPFNA